jgi:hypothetical protein
VPTAGSSVFHRLVCRLLPCRKVFYICCHCYRGQGYCSSRCREQARRLQRRQANHRHQQTPWGRDDHRDRQREYRSRLKARVTDQSSLRSSPRANLIAPSALELVEAAPPVVYRPSPGAERDEGWVVCQICGRRGRQGNLFAG